MEKMKVETVERRRLNLRALHFETDRIEFSLLECFLELALRTQPLLFRQAVNTVII